MTDTAWDAHLIERHHEELVGGCEVIARALDRDGLSLLGQGIRIDEAHADDVRKCVMLVRVLHGVKCS